MIRTIHSGEREAVLDLLGQWEGESRAHFARYFAHDPTFCDDLCFVAEEGGRLVATLQVLRKQVRFGEAVVEVAGVGNVFTDAAYRERGISTALLETALAAMPRHGFEVSLLFATRLEFYGRLGWQSHTRRWAYVVPAPTQLAGDTTIAPFELDDLEAVRSIYDAAYATTTGTTVRDRAYWLGQLHTAGQLSEDFLVARRDGRIVAYARGTRLYGLYVLIESAHAPGHAADLAALVQRLATVEAAGEAGVATQLGTFPEVLACLRRAGATVQMVDDYFWMWRVVDAAALARRLGCPTAAVEAPDFWLRALPPDASVYWLSDRF